jgi:hypothetical protein
MFNAPRFNSEKDVSLKIFLALNEANTCVPGAITTKMDINNFLPSYYFS